jgi:hypothetical protein
MAKTFGLSLQKINTPTLFQVFFRLGIFVFAVSNKFYSSRCPTQQLAEVQRIADFHFVNI